MTKITYIPGEIANAAIDEHGNRKPVTRTQHIFDDTKGKSQAEVNADVDNSLALHQSEINALNNQNYVTVDSFNALPATGAVDTVYRVSNWNGTQQDPTVYSEYAWNGTQYKLLDVKDYGVDNEPTAGSDNLVKSGGVWNQFQSVEVNINNELTGVIDFTNSEDRVWYTVAGEKTYNTNRKRTSFIPVKLGDIFKYYLNNTTTVYEVCALDKDFNLIPSQSVVGSGTVSERTYIVSDASVCYLIFCDHQVNNPYCRKNDYFLKRIDARFTTVDNEFTTVNGGLSEIKEQAFEKLEVFDKTAVRRNYSIKSSSPYSIIEYNGIIISDFIDIRKFKKIVYSGITTNGAVFARLSETAEDNSDSMLIPIAASGTIDITSEMSEYPYLVMDVYRGNDADTANLDSVSILGYYKTESLESRIDILESDVYQSGSYLKNLIRLQNISPTKATVCFALDLVGNSNVLEYLDLLAEYNINSANVFVIPRLISQSTILEECAQIINKGATVELHSDPLDNITPESSLTESQYYDLIAGYLDTMKGAGFYPSGFVASQGNMKEAYIPLLSNVMCWASTTSNIIARTQTSLETGYNTPQTNRCNIKRIGLDLRPVDATEENVTRIINMVKTAVDDAVENGYYLIFYVHSYDMTELDYTGREELLRPILAYIKGYADKYRISCGNIGELLNVYYK